MNSLCLGPELIDRGGGEGVGGDPVGPVVSAEVDGDAVGDGTEPADFEPNVFAPPANHR